MTDQPLYRPDQAETNRRLAQSLCVTCTAKLYNNSPDTMFCSENCELSWRHDQADWNSGGVSVHAARPEHWPEHSPPQAGETPPTWLGNHRPHWPHWDWQTTPPSVPAAPTGLPTGREPVPDRHENHIDSDIDWQSHIDATLVQIARAYQIPVPLLGGPERPDIRIDPDDPNGTITIGPELPASLDYTLDTAGLALAQQHQKPAYSITHIRPTRPGTPVTGDYWQRTTTVDPTPAIEQSRIAGHPALAQAPPPAEPRQRWNPVSLHAMTVQREYRFAIPTSNTAAAWDRYHQQEPNLRADPITCPRCGQPSIPVPVTALFPYLPHQPLTDTVFIASQEMTKLCCNQCWLPYPGPPIVPMIRTANPVISHMGPQNVSFALCHPSRYAASHLSNEAITHLPDGAITHLWKDLRLELTHQLRGWICCHPECANVATLWVAAAARMSWAGRLWEPSDGEPLHMGLCPRHYHSLVYEMLTADSYGWAPIPLSSYNHGTDGTIVR